MYTSIPIWDAALELFAKAERPALDRRIRVEVTGPFGTRGPIWMLSRAGTPTVFLWVSRLRGTIGAFVGSADRPERELQVSGPVFDAGLWTAAGADVVGALVDTMTLALNQAEAGPRAMADAAPAPSPAETAETAETAQIPKAFISYSWDGEDHKQWVKSLAKRLIADGIEVVLDVWHVAPGDQLPAFMERAVREADFVLMVCTEKYKDRSDGRKGGVGFEGHIITAEIFLGASERKFIPILRGKTWRESSPSWMGGKSYIDLRGDPYSEEQYEAELVKTVHDEREKPPPVVPRRKAATTVPAPASEARDSRIAAAKAISQAIGQPKAASIDSPYLVVLKEIVDELNKNDYFRANITSTHVGGLHRLQVVTFPRRIPVERSLMLPVIVTSSGHLHVPAPGGNLADLKDSTADGFREYLVEFFTSPGFRTTLASYEQRNAEAVHGWMKRVGYRTVDLADQCVLLQPDQQDKLAAAYDMRTAKTISVRGMLLTPVGNFREYQPKTRYLQFESGGFVLDNIAHQQVGVGEVEIVGTPNFSLDWM